MDAQHTIVIADDHPLFRNALFQSVHMAISGANLLEADSLESLHQILARDAEVDLVLLDLKMPGANGMSGLIALRHQHPSLPIVVVSASEEHRVIRQVRSHGAFGFIPKSSDMRALVQSLTQVLEGTPVFPMILAKKMTAKAYPTNLPRLPHSNTRCCACSVTVYSINKSPMSSPFPRRLSKRT